MSVTYSIDTEVGIIRRDTFIKCTCLRLGVNDISIEVTEIGADIKFNLEETSYWKVFLEPIEDNPRFEFVLLDTTKKTMVNQIVGLAERDEFDDSTPGTAYLFD